jgi:type VI secretion system protein ImpC
VATVLEALLGGVAEAERPRVRQGLKAVVAGLARAGAWRGADLVDAAHVDSMIAELDRRMSAQLDEILHHPDVQALEAAWRGLRFVIDHVREGDNIFVELCSVSKQELADDFADAPEIPQSGLYRLVYSSAYATFGGKPYGLICANYDFGPGAEDLGLLRQCAAVAAMAHSPFIANAAANFFGLDCLDQLPRVRDLRAILSGPRYRLWHSFRDTEDARYVGLCLPRMLMRQPYRVDSDPFMPLRYRERVEDDHEHFLWGRASFAFAVRAIDSFSRTRWCVYIIGSRAGGMIDDFEQIQFPSMPGLSPRCPFECLVTSRIEHMLMEEGFIALVYDRASGGAMIHSAASTQRPRRYADTEEGRAAQASERLGAQLPYMFLVCRLSHYIKRVQSERLGQWDSRDTLQKELTQWLRGFVSDVENPHWETRARKPLRKASIKVESVEGQTGWYRCQLLLQPHLTHNSASFTLSLLGRLEKSAGVRE